MKRLFYFLAIIPFLNSCSSSDDSSSNSGNEYFNLNYESQTINITDFQAQRSEKTIAVTAVSSEGLGISFEFNELGDVGNVYTYPVSSSAASVYDLYSSYRHYDSHYFNFDMINLDDQAKTVEVNFSGDLYDDQYALGGSSVHIEGNFKIQYIDVTPSVSGLGFTAKIGSDTFMDAVSDVSGGFFSGSDIGITYYNGSEYTLTLNMNHNNTVIGTYNFNSSSTVNNVVLSKFDTSSEFYLDYISSGTLTITEKTVGLQFTVVKGTFSFTATNPDDSSQISVSNGSFVSSYETY